MILDMDFGHGLYNIISTSCVFLWIRISLAKCFCIIPTIRIVFYTSCLAACRKRYLPQLATLANSLFNLHSCDRRWMPRTRSLLSPGRYSKPSNRRDGRWRRTPGKPTLHLCQEGKQGEIVQLRVRLNYYSRFFPLISVISSPWAYSTHLFITLVRRCPSTGRLPLLGFICSPAVLRPVDVPFLLFFMTGSFVSPYIITYSMLHPSESTPCGEKKNLRAKAGRLYRGLSLVCRSLQHD